RRASQNSDPASAHEKRTTASLSFFTNQIVNYYSPYAVTVISSRCCEKSLMGKAESPTSSEPTCVTSYCSRAHNRVFDLPQNILVLVGRRTIERARKFAQQRLLFLRKMRRHRHIDRHNQVAAPASFEIRHALALD